ncbi:right-handed parallel beta-helix repeat-containing protein, partial [Methanobrevibacter sp.]|uniref:right-handed parallel beta-helix repeat-containing protein n=1 Tax=Methanobrevibacter sp. TaxID=66852 RepID=UPI0038656E83
MDKKVFNLFFISLLFLFLVSSVSATDIQDDNMTILSSGSNHFITSDLSNEDIQSQFDNANDGDTFEFTDPEYQDISLVVDKKLNIISKKDSVVYVSDEVSDKAREMGIDKTFGFYFTSNAAGSVLSGINIVASNSDYGIVADNTRNIKITNNNVAGGGNGVLIKNSDKITMSENDISKAKQNGVQLQNVKNSIIERNVISLNKKSGIETSNIEYCKILNNTIHHNGLNGISTFNKSSHTLISGNNVYENTNGIYINSTSTNDVVKSNSMTHNRKDPRSSMGGFETGNGLLFGAGFKSQGDSILKVEYNYLAHNEFYQAKNYWENENFELGQNWYNSNDPTNTFVCPRLLASLMTL